MKAPRSEEFSARTPFGTTFPPNRVNRDNPITKTISKSLPFEISPNLWVLDSHEERSVSLESLEDLWFFVIPGKIPHDRSPSLQYGVLTFLNQPCLRRV